MSDGGRSYRRASAPGCARDRWRQTACSSRRLRRCRIARLARSRRRPSRRGHHPCVLRDGRSQHAGRRGQRRVCQNESGAKRRPGAKENGFGQVIPKPARRWTRNPEQKSGRTGRHQPPGRRCEHRRSSHSGFPVASSQPPSSGHPGVGRDPLLRRRSGWRVDPGRRRDDNIQDYLDARAFSMNAISSAVETRPRIALRCGKRPKRAMTSI